MKIAVTADNHLSTKDTYPERFTTFSSIIKKCDNLSIDLLIVAGDMFDKIGHSFTEFESIYRDNEPKGLRTIVIPGNHDVELAPGMISLDNLEIINEPELRSLENDWIVLYVPYLEGKTMGEVIAPFSDEIKGEKWVLVGHGNWTQGLHSPNIYEPGVYMPLTQSDIIQYKPEKVFLGHIHMPFYQSKVYYPGSPCPIDITETGIRKMLVFDTGTSEVKFHTVDSPLLFGNEEFVVLPGEIGLERLKQQIKTRIEDWGVEPEWNKRVKVRVKVKGYTHDRPAVEELVRESFEPFNYYNPEESIIDELKHSEDRDRAFLVEQFKNWIENIDLPEGTDEPSHDDILIEALNIIYGS